MSVASESAKRMLGYLPAMYEGAERFQAFLEAQGKELDQLKGNITEILNQHFPQKATWGLPLWEEALGITPAAGQPDEERQARVLAGLRGTGTLTIGLIRRVAESYQNGQVLVVPDFPSATMVVRFVDVRGTPPNIADLQAQLRRMVPARYELVFEYSYLTWDQFDALNLTWNDLDQMMITWDQVMTLDPSTVVKRAFLNTALTGCEQ